MLWKCCTQYASKFKYENAAVATGLEKVSFHSNPKERQCQRMLKLLHNCTHLITSKVVLKISKPGFSHMWTVNFQMFKLVLEKAEEPEIKLPASTGSLKKQESSRKNIYFCFIDYAKAFDCVDHNKLWKILKEMGIPDHLTCLLRNLYASQEAIVRTGHGKTDWFQIGKWVHQGCILSSCLFNYMQSASREMLDWKKHKLAILIPACASSSPAFLMMYSAYKLNKQGDNLRP